MKGNQALAIITNMAHSEGLVNTRWSVPSTDSKAPCTRCSSGPRSIHTEGKTTFPGAVFT